MENVPGKKILLVDDDTTFVNLYSAVFKSRNMNFSIAKTGAEGLLKAQDQPDLILLDIMLPDISGLDVLKRLKQDSNTANIEVWILSNLSNQANIDNARELGAKDYILKASHTPNQVLDKINNYFQGAANKPLQ